MRRFHSNQTYTQELSLHHLISDLIRLGIRHRFRPSMAVVKISASGPKSSCTFSCFPKRRLSITLNTPERGSIYIPGSESDEQTPDESQRVCIQTKSSIRLEKPYSAKGRLSEQSKRKHETSHQQDLCIGLSRIAMQPSEAKTNSLPASCQCADYVKQVKEHFFQLSVQHRADCCKVEL